MWVSDIVEITVNTTSVDSGSGTPGKIEGEQKEELIEDIDDKQTSNTKITLNVAPQISRNTAISSILASE